MKKQVPQIVEETGISGDYWNEYYWIITELKMKNGKIRTASALRKSPAQHYEERYPPTKYENPVNKQNYQRAQDLNRLADMIN